MRQRLLAAVAFVALATAARADPAVLNRIADEGFGHSQVVPTLQGLTEAFGPRLTASPQSEAAAGWAAEKFQALGLNVSMERFPFPQGWSFSRADARLLGEGGRTLRILPEAWTPGTAGPVRGQTVVVIIKSPADYAQYRGKLKGRIVLVGGPVAIKTAPSDVQRLDAAALAKLAQPEAEDDSWIAGYLAEDAERDQLDKFLAEEGAIAAVWPSPRSGGVIQATGYTYWPDRPRHMPQLVMGREDFNALARSTNSELEIDVAASFHPDRNSAVNVIADIPGETDEVILVGAHFDSWHAATGALDNGAGVAILMEAARLIKASGVKPHRTIRFGLWQGEEQGMQGSQAYAARHFGARPKPKDGLERYPLRIRQRLDPITPGPERDRYVLSFNIDAGSGRIRGLNAGPDPRAQALLEQWRKPVARYGVDVISPQVMQQSDDWAFRDIGLPAFGFVQDPLDYFSRTHHSSLDLIDYARPDELSQAAVVVASYLWQAAEWTGRLDPAAPKP
jgi:carboxypeptidase Q